jgi:hypothetical protein
MKPAQAEIENPDIESFIEFEREIRGLRTEDGR